MFLKISYILILLFIGCEEDHLKATNFIKGLNEYSLLENWFESHSMELGWLESSGLRPYRVVSAVLYFETQGNTVEEIMGK